MVYKSCVCDIGSVAAVSFVHIHLMLQSQNNEFAWEKQAHILFTIYVLQEYITGTCAGGVAGQPYWGYSKSTVMTAAAVSQSQLMCSRQ